MDKYNTELFGEFTYSERLTYESLLAYENFLLKKIETVLQDAGAEHLDFTPLGDTLMFQCAFVAQNLEILRDVADELASILPLDVYGRILCLEKNLISYHIIWIEQGKWQEKECVIPSRGDNGLPVHKVDVDKKTIEEEINL